MLKAPNSSEPRRSSFLNSLIGLVKKDKPESPVSGSGDSTESSIPAPPTVSEVLGSKTNKNLKIALVANKYIKQKNYDTAQKLLASAQNFPYKSLTDYLLFQCVKVNRGEWPIDWHAEFPETKEVKEEDQEIPAFSRLASPVSPRDRESSKSVSMVVTSSGAVPQSETLPLTEMDLLEGLLGSLSVSNAEGFLAQVILQNKEKFIEQIKAVAAVAQKLEMDSELLIDKIAQAFKAKEFIPLSDRLQIRIHLKGGVDFLSGLSVKTGKELSEAKAAVDILVHSNRMNTPSRKNPKETGLGYVIKTDSLELLEHTLGKPEINLKQFPDAITTAVKSKDTYFRPKALEMLLARKELEFSDQFTQAIDALQKEGEYALAKWWFEQAKQKLHAGGVTEAQSVEAVDIYVSANFLAYNLGKCADIVAPFHDAEEEKGGPNKRLTEDLKETLFNYLQSILFSLKDSSQDDYLVTQFQEKESAFLKQIKTIFWAVDTIGIQAQHTLDEMIALFGAKATLTRENFWKIKVILKGGVDALSDIPMGVADSQVRNQELVYTIDTLVYLGLINQLSKEDPRKTAADYIAAVEDIELLKYLLGKPAVNLNQSPFIIATILCARNEAFRYEALDLVLARNDIDLSTLPEEVVLSPLHTAVQNGDKIAALKFIRAKAFVNIPNPEGLTPLHLAAEAGREDLVSILIRSGAHLDAVGGRAKETPLHMAFNHTHFEACVRLMEAGAHLNIPNKNGDTFLHLIDKPIDTQAPGETRKISANYHTLTKLLSVKKQIDGNYLKMIEKWIACATRHLDDSKESVGHYHKITRVYILPIMDNLNSATIAEELVRAGFNTSTLVSQLQAIKMAVFPTNAYPELERLEKVKKNLTHDRMELWQKLAMIGQYWLDCRRDGDPEILRIFDTEIKKVNAQMQAVPNPSYYVDMGTLVTEIQKKPEGIACVKQHADFFATVVARCTQNKYLFIYSEEIEKQIMGLASRHAQITHTAGESSTTHLRGHSLLLPEDIFKEVDAIAKAVSHITFESRLNHAIKTRHFSEINHLALDDLSSAGFGAKKEHKEHKVIAEELAFLLIERMADNHSKAIAEENFAAKSRDDLEKKESRQLSETYFKRSVLFSAALKTLIQAQPLNLNATDSEGLTLLHRSAQWGAEEIVKLMLSGNRLVDLEVIAGVTIYAGRPNERVGDDGGRSDKTALHYAIENGHNSIVALLANGGANLDNKGGDKVDITPIRSTVFSRGAADAGGKRRENFVAATTLLCCDRQKINSDYLDVLEKWIEKYAHQQYSSDEVSSLIHKMDSAGPTMINLDEAGLARLQQLKSELAVLLSQKEEVESRAVSLSISPPMSLFKRVFTPIAAALEGTPREHKENKGPDVGLFRSPPSPRVAPALSVSSANSLSTPQKPLVQKPRAGYSVSQ